MTNRQEKNCDGQNVFLKMISEWRIKGYEFYTKEREKEFSRVAQL
jgi:hypothetical protein